MRFFLALICLVAACAAPGAAQSHLAPEDPIGSCLAAAGIDLPARRACIGVISAPCMDEPFGSSTAGMIGCAERERAAWERIRDAAAQHLRSRETPSQIAALDAALTEHASWTQARCAYAASAMEGGSLARYLAAECLRTATAELALELFNRRSDD